MEIIEITDEQLGAADPQESTAATKKEPQIIELTPPRGGNFAARFSDDFKKRGAMMKEIDNAVASGEQGYAETVFQMLGKVGAGVMLDFVGEAVVSAGRGLSAITPDEIEDPIIDTASKAAHAFINTDLGQSGINAARMGIE